MDYFALCAEDNQQVLLDKTVADYTQSLQLTRTFIMAAARRSRTWPSPKHTLETARTQAADIRLQRAQTEHAIAVLLGENPSAFHAQSTPLRPELMPPGDRSRAAFHTFGTSSDVARRNAESPLPMRKSAWRVRRIFRYSVSRPRRFRQHEFLQLADGTKSIVVRGPRES